MAQSLVANVSITDQDQKPLVSGNYKAIEIDFISPGPRQVDITSDSGSATGIHEKQRFQISFPSQGTALIHGGASLDERQENFTQLYKGNANKITIKDATGSNSIEKIYVMPQDGTNWNELTLVNNPSQVVMSITRDIIPPPVTGGGVIDEFGMKILYGKHTGKKVAMKKGKAHENGQRYNVNHEFHNYIMQGYFKLGKGQEKINHKGDGPNHGGCKDDKVCAWYELDYVLATGKGELQLENPHPDNHEIPDSDCEFVKTLAPSKPGQWIGWATAYFWGPDGKRHIRSAVDLDPFDSAGNPKNNWQDLVFAIERGQIFKGITHPRNMQEVIEHEAGLESEIRMHRATSGDTEIRNCFVFELEPQGTPS